MRRGFASTQPQRWRAGCREVFGRVPKRSGGSGSAVKAQTAPPTLRSKPVLMRQTQMSLRQPQAFLRVPRGRLVSLLTPLGRLNAGECDGAAPRASRHKRLHLYAVTFRRRRANPGSRADQ